MWGKGDGAANKNLELPLLVTAFAVSAVAVHVARYWRPLAVGASLIVTGFLLWAVNRASSEPFELAGLTFALQPLTRDYLRVAVVQSGALAISTALGTTRRSLGFLFWSWIAWLIALVGNDFVVGVFAWAAGLATMVIAMEPRRTRRVGGAATYLVLIVIAGASLLIGHRFIELYPLTPEQLSLISSAVLFLAWGLGLMLALIPFALWLGPLADETPLPILAVLLGLGQPIGLWLLYELIGQYPRLLELSALVTIMTYGGLACIMGGGVLCAFERRAGRLMSWAALYALGFVLLDLSRGTPEGTAYAVLEIFARTMGLGLMASGLTIARHVENRWVNAAAVFVFSLGGLQLAGLGLGLSLTARWNALLEIQALDQRVFYLLMLSLLGVALGVIQYASAWLARGHEFGPTPSRDGSATRPYSTAPPSREDAASARSRRAHCLSSRVLRVGALWLPNVPRARRALHTLVQDKLGAARHRLVNRVPARIRRGAWLLNRYWRVAVGIALLGALAVFAIGYSWTPRLWFDHVLETVSQLAFLR